MSVSRVYRARRAWSLGLYRAPDAVSTRRRGTWESVPLAFSRPPCSNRPAPSPSWGRGTGAGKPFNGVTRDEGLRQAPGEVRRGETGGPVGVAATGRFAPAA